MTQRQFRITDIGLDGEENVNVITAVIREDALKVITNVLHEVYGEMVSRSEAVVELSAAEARKLFAECGAMAGTTEPAGRAASDVHGSLTRVFNGLIGA